MLERNRSRYRLRNTLPVGAKTVELLMTPEMAWMLHGALKRDYWDDPVLEELAASLKEFLQQVEVAPKTVELLRDQVLTIFERASVLRSALKRDYGDNPALRNLCASLKEFLQHVEDGLDG